MNMHNKSFYWFKTSILICQADALNSSDNEALVAHKIRTISVEPIDPFLTFLFSYK